MWRRGWKRRRESGTSRAGGRSIYAPRPASRSIRGTQRWKGLLLCRTAVSASAESCSGEGAASTAYLMGRTQGHGEGARLGLAQGIAISLHSASGTVPQQSAVVDLAALPCAAEASAAQIHAAEMDLEASVTCTGDGKCRPGSRQCPTLREAGTSPWAIFETAG
jgi:hypothetical protein